MRRADDRVAVMTVGARGIGRVACPLLADDGARVAVRDLREDEAKTVTGSELVLDGGHTAG